MAKPRIDAVRALEDIRAGMDDSALMEKYNLSAKGLASLFRKLASIGSIRWLNAQDIVNDIREGLSEADLSEKYKLSWTGLESLLSELVKKGISRPFGHNARVGMKRKISQQQIVHDIHSGMTETQLMAKYELSSWGIQRVLGKLLAVGAITWEQIAILSLSADDSVTVREMRQDERSYPLVSMAVYEQARPMIRGRILDLSERGLGVIGIPSEVDELKTLTIAPYELIVFEPLALQATCKWFRKGDFDATCTAGFAITQVEDSILEQLRDLLDSMAATLPA